MVEKSACTCLQDEIKPDGQPTVFALYTVDISVLALKAGGIHYKGPATKLFALRTQAIAKSERRQRAPVRRSTNRFEGPSAVIKQSLLHSSCSLLCLSMAQAN